MNKLSMGGTDRLVLMCGLVIAASPALGAVWLFVHISGHGSHAGNILRAGFGFLLVLVSLFVIGVGAIRSRNSSGRSGTNSDAHL